MGVDFITCKLCKYNFPDCGDYARCGVCETYFCSSCGDEYSFVSEDDLYENEKDPEGHPLPENTCPFCTKSVITDKEVLEFALAKLGATRKELEAEIRADHKGKNKSKNKKNKK